MLEELQELFSTFADVTGLQVLTIDLPSSFEAKIVETEVQKQIKKTRENEQKAAITRAEIDVMLAGFRKEETIIKANATADATLTVNTARAYAQKNNLDAEKSAID